MNQDQDDQKWLDETELDAALLRLTRLQPVKRIKVSPEYAAFLENELDSDGYARSLVSAYRDRTKLPPTVISGERPDGDAVPVEGFSSVSGLGIRPTTPEYRQFLNHEISSREYAIALATCARLEGQFQSPSQVPSRHHFEMQRSGKRGLLLWLGISYVMLPLLAILVVPLAIGSGLDLIPVARDWSGTAIGGLLLATTAIASRSTTLRGWVQASASSRD